jgi:hypothetical protein
MTFFLLMHYPPHTACAFVASRLPLFSVLWDITGLGENVDVRGFNPSVYGKGYEHLFYMMTQVIQACRACQDK